MLSFSYDLRVPTLIVCLARLTKPLIYCVNGLVWWCSTFLSVLVLAVFNARQLFDTIGINSCIGSFIISKTV